MFGRTKTARSYNSASRGTRTRGTRRASQVYWALCERRSEEPMSGMMDMMMGTGIIGVLALVALVLLIAALIKYLFFSRPKQ